MYIFWHTDKQRGECVDRTEAGLPWQQVRVDVVGRVTGGRSQLEIWSVI